LKIGNFINISVFFEAPQFNETSQTEIRTKIKTNKHYIKAENYSKLYQNFLNYKMFFFLNCDDFLHV